MSRIGSLPIEIPAGVEVVLQEQLLRVKGPKGQLEQKIPSQVSVAQQEKQLLVTVNDASKQASALSGTIRSLAHNMCVGVSAGFEKKLNLVGVGYRAQLQGTTLNLELRFSHPVVYKLPEGITAQVNSQTEITIQGIDKQKVGQVAAEIRRYRPPDAYKGKGVRYADEVIVRKEAKKK